MRNKLFLGGIFSLVLILILLGASCSYSSASLSDVTMASEINSETMEPVNKAETFTPTAEIIYAVVKLNNAPEETKIKAVWYYLEGEETEIASKELTADGTRWLGFSLTKPTNGWPEGKYKVDFYVDEVLKATVNFTVSK